MFKLVIIALYQTLAHSNLFNCDGIFYPQINLFFRKIPSYHLFQYSYNCNTNSFFFLIMIFCVTTSLISSLYSNEAIDININFNNEQMSYLNYVY